MSRFHCAGSDRVKVRNTKIVTRIRQKKGKDRKYRFHVLGREVLRKGE